MIATIGSLVQETSTRLRWAIATGLYILGCVATSTLLGAALSVPGSILRHAVCNAPTCAPGRAALLTTSVLIGLIAVAYALSDLGFVRLPRPFIMYAVPVTWWRRWQPYGAALAYGAALGLGVTTLIPFGAFYALCAICLLNGHVVFGILLMGTYGAARGLSLIPTSWTVFGDCTDAAAHRDVAQRRMGNLLTASRDAQGIMAGALIAFGIQVLISAAL